MPATTPCTPCCTTTPPVQVPGPEGDAGTNGDDGLNAYTTLTAPLTLPAVGSDVTANVVNSAWMAIGATIVMDGPAHFEVVSKPNATSALVTFLGASGDLASGIIASGATVSAAGVWGLPAPLTVYGAGTAYVLTTTYAAIDLGTTDPTRVITTPGTYLIFCRLVIAAAAASIVAETASFKLYRTTPAAGDVANTEMTYDLPVMTTLTHTIGVVELQPVVYTTANSTDSLSLYGKVSADPTGDITVTEASIVAVRLY